MFGPSTAAAFFTQRGTLAEVSTTASHLRPFEGLQVVLLAIAVQLLQVGEQAGAGLAAIEQRDLVPAPERGLDGLRAEEAGAAQHQDRLWLNRPLLEIPCDRVGTEERSGGQPRNSRRFVISVVLLSWLGWSPLH